MDDLVLLLRIPRYFRCQWYVHDYHQSTITRLTLAPVLPPARFHRALFAINKMSQLSSDSSMSDEIVYIYLIMSTSAPHLYFLSFLAITPDSKWSITSKKRKVEEGRGKSYIRISLPCPEMNGSLWAWVQYYTEYVLFMGICFIGRGERAAMENHAVYRGHAAYARPGVPAHVRRRHCNRFSQVWL